jgi:predicted amidohydrolase YtcJ
VPRSHDGWVVDGDGELSARWQRSRLDLAGVGRRLIGHGVTSVTDATPTDALGHLAKLAGAAMSGDLPFRVTVMGGIGLVDAAMPAPLGRGPVKLMVPDGEGVDLDGLAASIALAHEHGRPVALHCVTAVAAAISLAAWDLVGAIPGDRLEHGSVLSDDVVDALVDLGIRIVTQPAFVHDRGDHYLAEVEGDEVPLLYRCGSLFDAGLEVWGSSDAPFGPDDPWLAMRTAVDRRTRSGAVLGSGERVTPERALAMWGSDEPRVGAVADLVLLDGPLAAALDDLDASHVAATFVGGVRLE